MASGTALLVAAVDERFVVYPQRMQPPASLSAVPMLVCPLLETVQLIRGSASLLVTIMVGFQPTSCIAHTKEVVAEAHGSAVVILGQIHWRCGLLATLVYAASSNPLLSRLGPQGTKTRIIVVRVPIWCLCSVRVTAVTTNGLYQGVGVGCLAPRQRSAGTRRCQARRGGQC
jgi:hypothetical protein